jgi:diaminopimelate decarboxylase
VTRKSAISRDAIETPAFIVRPGAIAASRDELARLCRLADCRALYSLKALGLPDVLQLMSLSSQASRQARSSRRFWCAVS